LCGHSDSLQVRLRFLGLGTAKPTLHLYPLVGILADFSGKFFISPAGVACEVCRVSCSAWCGQWTALPPQAPIPCALAFARLIAPLFKF